MTTTYEAVVAVWQLEAARVVSGLLRLTRDLQLAEDLAQDALVAALESGRITAAVDVVDPEPLPEDSPLWTAPGLLITPHVGGASSAMWPRAYRLVRDQLHRYANGEEPVNIMTGSY